MPVFNIDTEFRKKINDAIVLFFYVFLFFLPSFQKISIICLFFIAFLFLINLKLNAVFNNFRYHKVLLLPILFYIIHVLGLLYSENLAFGLFDLEVKFVFLAVPLLLAGTTYTTKQYNNFKVAFILGNLTAVFFCFIRATENYIETNASQFFFYKEFSYFLHPSYFSLYLSFCIILILHYLLNLNIRWMHQLGLYIVLMFFIMSITLLTSRTGIVVAIISILLFFILKIYQGRKFSMNLILRMILTLLFFSSTLYILTFYDRFTHLENEIAAISEYTGRSKSVESNEVSPTRFQIWINSIKLIKSNLLIGVGTGDIKDELNRIYKPNDLDYLNAHNQYLQTSATLGVVGLIILLLMYFYPILFYLKTKNIIPLLFLLIIILNSATESILERQAGVLFFAFFYVILYSEAGER